MSNPDEPTRMEWMRWRTRRAARRFRRRHDITFLAVFAGLLLVVLLAMWLY